ncbi:adhesion G protein-coupled receptor F5-like isoform X2 [Triplophysa dalaica]|uniref:adhesion G protein-coupled receptor F5-like isoform X2 n=1 Tax=Triplophysa dalaica TaxID=1582913 RepID=UPI0024DFB8C9|nr:adhesion G protein-coupled receptor F5-like isoform X2 [Triplophysa dalaica]
MTTCKEIVILFLGLLFKVSGSGDSTQIYFFEIEFDSSVETDVKGLILNSSTLISANQTVSNASISTVCTWNGNKKQCSCEEGYMWSSDACTKHKCCKTENCTVTDTDTVMCQSNESVSINGSSTMNWNYNDLFDSDNIITPKYKNITKDISNQLKGNFSELPWFDSLVITGFRSGSLIVDYMVQVLGRINLTQLENIATGLEKTQLVTKGLVTITVPKEQPVAIGSSPTVTCKRKEDLGSLKWVLTDTQNKSTTITDGAEAQLRRNKDNDTFTDTVQLQSISGSWKGLFTCEYTKAPITHIATEMLDIALLPDIRASSTPQFPDCTDTTKRIQIRFQCTIKVSTENYTVSWDSSDFSDLRSTSSVTQGDSIHYYAKATVNCEKKLTNELANVTCVFTNNRAKVNGSKNKEEGALTIPIIYSHSIVCDADNLWPKTKSSYTAVLVCDSGVGENRRNCTDGQWGTAISYCVNLGLYDIHKDVEEIGKGLGFIRENADRLISSLKTITTTDTTVNSFANINISVDILKQMNQVSINQSHKWNEAFMPNFVSTISNVLNDTQAWNQTQNANSLSVDYLHTVENMIKNSNLSSGTHKSVNVQLRICNSSKCDSFNVSVKTKQDVVVVAFKNLADILPKTLKNETFDSGTTILSVTAVNGIKSEALEMKFDGIQRRRNHKMYCVYWNDNENEWSSEGCTWGGAFNPMFCNCTHNSASPVLMSKHPVNLPYMEELTYACLGVSIVSLVLCILIEFLVWDTVVKSNIANFRHIALVNISVWLLLAYCAFLGTAEPKKTNSSWCLILTVVKHYCFLAVFFWTLCLSFLLLHQLIFIFEQLRKKVYLAFSITLGYVCPLVCVAVTFIHFDNGAVGKYYSNEACWLTYESGLNGSIFAFIFPVGTIVIINMFTLCVVIMKIVTPAVSEAKARDEKAVVKGIIKTIVFLSPILGITWIFGFLVFLLDLTQKPYAQIVNYAFTILNSLQGFFILLTNCFGEKKVREALLKRFRGKPLAHSKSDHSSKMTSVVKNK